MSITRPTRERTRPLAAASSGRTDSGPDPSWRGFYRAGGVSALLYNLLGLVVPTVMVLAASYDFTMDGAALLGFIATHRLWWTVLQSLVLGSSIFGIVAFVALYLALKHLDKSYVALGALVASTCQLLFLAYYPVLLGLVELSNRYAAAPETERAGLATAAEALIAQNNAFNPLYESMFALSILILSLVMLKGVFPRSVALLGVATTVSAFVGLALWPVLGVSYFWWWLLFLVWFTAVGWKLITLGAARPAGDAEASRTGRPQRL